MNLGKLLNNVDPIRYRSDLNRIGCYHRDSTAKKNIYLPDVVGKGYKLFWNFKGRYRVVKVPVHLKNLKLLHYGIYTI